MQTRSRSDKNVADARLVEYLAKRRRFYTVCPDIPLHYRLKAAARTRAHELTPCALVNKQAIAKLLFCRSELCEITTVWFQSFAITCYRQAEWEATLPLYIHHIFSQVAVCATALNARYRGQAAGEVLQSDSDRIKTSALSEVPHELSVRYVFIRARARLNRTAGLPRVTCT